jgi:hypothetical protein
MVRVTHAAAQQPEDVPAWLGLLSEPELRLWLAFPHGAAVDYSSGDPGQDSPANAAHWDPRRQIRAAVVAALALGARSPIPGRTAGVRVVGAHVVGQLDLRHGIVEVPLTMRYCYLEHTVRFDEAVTKSVDLTGSHTGRILAEGAHIRGSLKLAGATINGGEDFSLHLDEVTIDTDLHAKGLTCLGSLCLIGARIGAVLDLTESRLHHPQHTALNIGGAVIGRTLLLGKADIRGQVRMPGAAVGGMALLSRTRITECADTAFEGEALNVSGGGYFQHGFHAEGMVVLVGARFGGVLSFRDASLSGHAGEPALNANGLRVERSLYLTHGFRAVGEVKLTALQVSGHLDLVGMAPDSGHLTLYHASIGTIRDEGCASWPSSLILDGLKYTAFDPYLPANTRKELLARQYNGYHAQPYEFMAAYYRELGHDEEARDILLTKERVRRTTAGRWSRLGGVIFDTLVGYGYRPLRAVAFSVLIQLAATGFFAIDRPTQISPDEHLAYYPAWYAADLFVPIVHFGQTDQFQSHGFAAGVAMVLPYLGWIVGIAIVAGASRTLSRGSGVLGQAE